MPSPSLPPGSATTVLSSGQILAGKYRVGRTLGAGGMCLVYEAEHIHLRQGVALKVLKPELARDPTSVARFAQEAQAAARLRSPNVARVYDVDTLPDGQPYITMELLVGNDLGTELTAKFSLPTDIAVDYVRQATTGIAEAHALGIVHRDLKPENLFLTDLGSTTPRKLVKILDFGIAKDIHENARKLTAPDAIFGTVDYMSPEQIRSASTVDHRTDIWSLGVILFELLTGRTPYSGDARSVIAQIVSEPVISPASFVPTLPPTLVGVIMRALQKDPAHRFQSAEELAQALTPFTSGLEPIADIVTRLPPATVPRRVVESSRPTERDARTNLSFETNGGRTSWTKRGWVVPLVGAASITILGVTMWSKNLIGPARTPVPPLPAVVASPPPAVTAVPVPTLLGASTPDPLPAASSAAVPPEAPHSAARPKPARPPPRATSPSQPPEPSPSALPKHL